MYPHTPPAFAKIEPRQVLDDITVLIPTLGRAILAESLYCIATACTWPQEIIVVDQGRRQQVAEWLHALQELGMHTTYIPSTQRGRAAALNRGLEKVRTRFVTVTDDDCFVDADWLSNMRQHLSREPLCIVTGRVEAGDDDVIVVVRSTEPAVYRRPRLRFDSLSGGNMGTSMRVFERVGLFDEHPCMSTAEDGEWAYRALRAGVSIIYQPDIVVHHMGWRDEQGRVSQYKGYARSHGGFYGKYLRKGDWFIALRAVIHHLRALRRWLRGIVAGDRELAANGRAYFMGLLPGIIAGMLRATPNKRGNEFSCR